MGLGDPDGEAEGEGLEVGLGDRVGEREGEAAGDVGIREGLAEAVRVGDAGGLTIGELVVVELMVSVGVPLWVPPDLLQETIKGKSATARTTTTIRPTQPILAILP